MAKYNGVTYPIMAVDFEEHLIAIITAEYHDDEVDDDIKWVRCENVQLI